MNPDPMARRGFLAGLVAGLGGLLGLGCRKAKAGWRSTWRREEFAGAKLDPAGWRIRPMSAPGAALNEIPLPDGGVLKTNLIVFDLPPPGSVHFADICIHIPKPIVRFHDKGDSPREA